ncbi:Flp pilus assembly protein TadG [Shimia isoporae]|uniref:Flp pilus assembly protein TadG n=1 Tax=Shimia isoporae TaxID=647720 RepID=A0A4R1NN90_9RHOB|nr:TadE/TadG family type IV pilus assembly protein [Shimia isoporae]TCL09936.1 Flp pilus assembly protein TadG [Shimia isoporae]
MITRMTSLFRQFRRREEGHVSTEFAIMVPILLVTLVSAVELGVMTLRYSMLERSLDIVVRDIRLNTGYNPDHDDMITRICDEATMIPDCNNNLKLEMVALDPRAWDGIPQNTICTDQSLEAQPVTTFTHGIQNELMVLRACAKVAPLFPTTGLGANFATDDAGDFALVVTNAFVQEPR